LSPGAGAVGSAVCQIADPRLHGGRPAGTDEKLAWFGVGRRRDVNCKSVP
jgi:NADPH-dependent curcumin reductase CurA